MTSSTKPEVGPTNRNAVRVGPGHGHEMT